jgi:translation initiation factor 2B subunit (eIF-2B alpha/beta/delta family)
MSARTAVSADAHANLDVFSELLHKFHPAPALERFSKHLAGKPLDVVSANAVQFVTQAVASESSDQELISRANAAKKQISLCEQQMLGFASQKFKNKTVLAHPLDALGTIVLHPAKQVRFIHANQKHIHELPLHKLEAHKPLRAANALEGVDLLLLEPRAITGKGIVVQQGGRTLAELASARGIPVYVAATSWHVDASREPSQHEDSVPASLITGIVSEFGIYPHRAFLENVAKSFPELIFSR